MQAATFALDVREAPGALLVTPSLDVTPLHASIPLTAPLRALACAWDCVCFVQRDAPNTVAAVNLHTAARREFRIRAEIICIGATAHELIVGTREDVFRINLQQAPGAAGPPVVELPLPILTTVRKVACGKTHFLVLSADGEVFAGGNNNYGQLGSGTVEPEPALQRVETLRGHVATDIACGGWHSLVLCGEGLLSFGWTCHGQLGRVTELQDSFNAHLHSPSQLPGPVRFATDSADGGEAVTCITGGASHSAAVRGGALWAWGWGASPSPPYQSNTLQSVAW